MKINAFLNSILGKEKRPPAGPGPLFALFKEVLDSNNRALEIITDMGEKLGGEFLFDINYIKKSYSELIDQMRVSMDRFNSLTNNKYKADGALERVDKAIRSVLDNSSSGELAYFYENITWDKAGEVGGKNFNLAELKNNLPLNVPSAFALTTRAFDEFIDFNQLRGKIGALSAESTPEELERVREQILSGSFPEDLDVAIAGALQRLTNERAATLAVRSSAGEEDRDYSSFAGQFETVLNVPASAGPVKEAYKKVLASLYTPGAFAYQKRLGGNPSLMKMPVACVLMVDAASAGVMYSSNPNPLTGGGELMISSVMGLGDLAVNGGSETDVFVVKKGTPPEVIDVHIGAKRFASVTCLGGGIKKVELPGLLGNRPSLNTMHIEELARIAQEIEKHFGAPQDIEWALGKDGKIYILQSRPLKIDHQVKSGSEEKSGPENPESVGPGEHKVLLERNGFVVQKGAAAGKAFLLKKMEELENVPRGSILIAKNDSPQFVRIMPHVQAIITDIGSPVNHMAAICREFRIPSVVNTVEGTKKIVHGQEITLDAREDGFAVYEGTIREVMERARKDFSSTGQVYEFRRATYVMRHISPLHLINPLTDDFTAEKCRTMHDLLRFVHEKSVQELIDTSKNYSGGRGLRKLLLPIPAGIQVVDIGGGIAASNPAADEKGPISSEEIASLPFRALLKGMTYPSAWNSEVVSINAGDFLSSMMRMKDITGSGLEYAGKNLAVISREYMNLSLRFGYHFNLVDSYCSEKAANNHIYFRFVGGATDITKRSRRIRLIAYVLGELGFQSNSKGDLILARISNISQGQLLEILEQAGRLIAFTRQLDAVLTDDSLIETLARNFLEGKYQLR